MSIESFFGKTVKLLWHDVPYVGELHSVDEEKNAVISNCRYFSGTICKVGSYFYTIRQLIHVIKLPINGITMIDDSSSNFNITNLMVEHKDDEKYYVIHCSKCARPSSVMPCTQATEAKFTIIGGVPHDGTPMYHEEFKQFLDNLPSHCDACSGITIPMTISNSPNSNS